MTNLNLYHPGRPGYTGPDSGWGGYVYHSHQVIYCRSFAERVIVIHTDKPPEEQAIRLACLTYLGPAPVEVGQAMLVYQQARQVWNRVAQAYVQVRLARERGERVYTPVGLEYMRALEAYRQAAIAYEQALQTASTSEVYTALLARLAELTPDAPWDGKRLCFGTKV